MVAPFEGLFGDTSELRTIQFLLPVRDLKFNISELARETRISRQTMMRVVAKLMKWNVLKIAGKYGGANYYALNEASGFINALEDLDNCIIEQMLGEETLTKIATYSAEQHIKNQPVRELSQSHVKGWFSESPDESWSRLHLEDRLKVVSLEKSSEVKKESVYSGGVYAAA